MPEQRNLSLVDIDPGSWPEIATGFADHNFEQSLDYAEAMARQTGAVVRFVGVRQSGLLIGAAAIRLKPIPLTKHAVAYISGGPLTVRRGEGVSREQRYTVLATLQRMLVEQEGHALYMRLPLTPQLPAQIQSDTAGLGFHPTRRVRAYRTICVDISPDEETLQARLTGKWRTDLKYAKKAGLTIEHGTNTAFCERFLKLFGEMHHVKNFDIQVDPRFFFTLPPDNIGLKVLIATKDGQDAAGHVLSMLGNTAVYLFGATNDMGRTAKAGYLLNWQSMILARQHGLSWYDLGGINPNANPGVYRFKKRMGGKELTAAGPYEVLPASIFGTAFGTLLSLRDRFKAK